MRRHVARQRGVVIVAVLVIVMSALLIATSMLYLMQADATIAVHGRESHNERALLWSGVQAIAGELELQRDACLEGVLPEVDEQYTLYERNGRAGIVRLLPVGPDGALIVAESAKLDVNLATVDMLASLDLIDEQLAARIVRHRDVTLGRPLQSIAELLGVPGVTPELLYGPMDEIEYLADAQGVDESLGDRVRTRLLGAEPRGLADVLTVWSVEPALQRSGKLRINLNVEWSDELEKRVADRFDENAARLLGEIFETTTFDDESVLYSVLKRFDVDPDEWPDIIDAFTADEGEHHFGRININQALPQVLVALPGVDEEIAATIAQVRDGLDDETSQTIAWCGIEEILDVDQYIELAGWLTTRSWTYHLRLAVGEVDLDEPDAAMEHLSIADVVIDLASPRARLAYLRDVTMFDVASALAAAGPLDDDFDMPLDDRSGDRTSDRGDDSPDIDDDDDDGPSDDPATDPPLGDPGDTGGTTPETDGAGDSETSSGSGSGGTSKGGRRIGRWIPGQ